MQIQMQQNPDYFTTSSGSNPLTSALVATKIPCSTLNRSNNAQDLADVTAGRYVMATSKHAKVGSSIRNKPAFEKHF